jgi:hypothetical protein
MVSGQDQDGHMKMTVELTKRALESGISLPGISNIPSGIYIPHIRGIIGKASSSKPETTIYLGSGPGRLDLDNRINDTNLKITRALQDSNMKENIELAALDMTRYIDFFNDKSKVDFGQLLKELPKGIRNSLNDEQDENARLRIIENYLIKACKENGQDNIELVRDSLPEALREHQRKRKVVLDYAIAKREYNDRFKREYSIHHEAKPEKPIFWKVPEKAVVEESKRNRTHWEDLVASMKDKLIP